MGKEEHQYKKQIKQGSEMEQVNAADREWKDDNVITQYDNKRTRESQTNLEKYGARGSAEISEISDKPADGRL